MAWTWRQGSVTRVVHDIFGAIGYFSIVIALTHAVVALSRIIESPPDFELVWFVLVQ